ncbi:hypothetical protein OIU84_018316 [Salix udensis]|uniref:Protein kinase domain-containing protein n=1 Tax=Salix udensis TaxID=889485 RepID=A0AAD6KW88_9ROSI|nr:hypothetical protein OIU84_018316 [Salix udensis]
MQGKRLVGYCAVWRGAIEMRTKMKAQKSNNTFFEYLKNQNSSLLVKKAGREPSVYNEKSESPKDQSPSGRPTEDDRKLPSNPEEVEDLRRDSAANPLIAFTFVAVKVHDGDNSYQGHREWLAEVIFLGQLSHPNLVKLIGYCCEDEQRVLIYEYMSRGSVENNLFSRVLLPLPWSIRMKIAYGAAKGLAFLHEAEKPVIYRDFKTSNILLDQDYNAKLSDFGLAKDGPIGDKTHVSTRIMGTYGYAAPEYIMTGHLTPRSDVYSFGVVLLELLTGRKSLDKSRPAREQNLTDWAIPLLKEKKKVLNIVDPRLDGDYPVKGVHKAAMLAYHCLNRNPKARPLMRDIVDSLEPLQEPEDVQNEKPVLTVIRGVADGQLKGKEGSM